MTTAVSEVPAIDVAPTALTDAADRISAAGRALNIAQDDALASWRGLRTSFHSSEFENRVWEGLDLVTRPVSDWESSMNSCQSAVDTFAATASMLKLTQASLETERAALVLASATAASPEAKAAVESRIQAFNSACTDLETDWHAAQEDLASALRGISGGENGDLPLGAGETFDGGPLDWSTVYGDVTADRGEDAWMLLSGMDRQERQRWLEEHPYTARVLAGRGVKDFLDAPTDSARVRDVQRFLTSHDPAANASDVDQMTTLWDGLTDEEQQQLLWQYPAVFGNLNGVPFNSRGEVNQVTVHGARQETQAKIDALEDRIASLRRTERTSTGAMGHTTQEGREAGRRANELEKQLEDARVVLAGLEDADAAYGRPHHPTAASGVEPGYDTLFLDTSGTGTIVTARGSVSSQTTHIMGFTPGTTTTLKSAKGYNGALDQMDGNAPVSTYSIYWAGTELPPTVPDNLDGRYNREGGPRLAAFDRSLELQTAGQDARKVWASHSAGSAMTGTAERHGMKLDAHVYVAPAGPGQGVDRTVDALAHDSGDPSAQMGNPEAERYLIQNPKDVISLAQGYTPAQSAVGGQTVYDSQGFVGGSSNPRWVFDDVVELESGVAFGADGSRTSVVGDGDHGGHSDYLQGDTLALRNINGVLEEHDVYPELGIESDWRPFDEDDPVRARPEEFRRPDDFPHTALDDAYRESTGKERPR